MFLYLLHDLQSLALAPFNQSLKTYLQAFEGPLAPLAMTPPIAQLKLLERSTRRYEKPRFNIANVKFRGETIHVQDQIIYTTPFCNLLHFKRSSQNEETAQHLVNDPKVLIITPMSGHYATLMRGTVEAMLPSHDVYITDWQDAKTIPLTDGFFDLEDQIGLLMNMMRMLSPDLHVLAISQASVSALCATALLAADNKSWQPLSLSLIGGPIDARGRAPALSDMAAEHSLSWIRSKTAQLVPFYYPGAYRMVYPGATQLADRMSMTLDRHITEQIKYYRHLVRGDDDAQEVHDKFYDEFLAVMDVPEEFYIQFVERAFQRCDLPNGSFTWRGRKVDLSAIRRTALLTIEGELDDLSPAGQTRAALELCTNLPTEMKHAHLEIGVGHYGVFNGRKWRNNIQPIVHKFIREHSLAPETASAA